jgi:putative chitinase
MPGKLNEPFFFDYVRQHLFDGKLSSKQTDGLKAILAEWNAKHAARDDRWLAYALGTAHHETGRTMQPIKEWGSNKYFFDMYDPKGKRPAVARDLGNRSGDGVKFPGRGYVQLTGRKNYTKWAARLKIDLVGIPDLALDARVAVRILFDGMEGGDFTTKKFVDYFNASKADWVNARRIINRLDKAALVASYGKAYYAAISHTT